MFKKISSLFLLLLAPFLLAACSSGVPKTDNSDNPSTKTERPRRPDFGQPETQPEIRGIVKSVVGNEVTVLKIDQPQGMGMATSTDAKATSTRPVSLNFGGTSGGGRGGVPGGNRPQGDRPEGDNSTANRAAMLEKIKAMSTGEEKVIIPIGIKMLKADSSSTGKQRTMAEATISDVAADKMITVWLNNSITDKKVASFVMIN